MKIYNKTKRSVIAENIIIAKTHRDRNIGLLAYKTPVAMLLKTRFGIHTFFMKYPIDVLVLDSESRIVKLRENLKPNDIFVWNPKYNTIIELPPKTIKQTQLALHDQIAFV